MAARPTPQYLYKYRHLSLENECWIQELIEQRQLYFPSPDQINDPFDCKVSLTTEGVPLTLCPTKKE